MEFVIDLTGVVSRGTALRLYRKYHRLFVAGDIPDFAYKRFPSTWRPLIISCRSAEEPTFMSSGHHLRSTGFVPRARNIIDNAQRTGIPILTPAEAIAATKHIVEGN